MDCNGLRANFGGRGQGLNGGFTNCLLLWIASTTHKTPLRNTIVSKIQWLCDIEKRAKYNVLADAKYIVLTRDHWALVSNYHNYLHTLLTVTGNFSHLHYACWRRSPGILLILALNSFCLWQRHGEFNIRLPQLEQTVLKTWELLQESFHLSTRLTHITENHHCLPWCHIGKVLQDNGAF